MSRRGGTSTSKGGGKKDKEVIDWEAVARLDEDCKEIRAYKWVFVHSFIFIFLGVKTQK